MGLTSAGLFVNLNLFDRKRLYAVRKGFKTGLSLQWSTSALHDGEARVVPSSVITNRLKVATARRLEQNFKVRLPGHVGLLRCNNHK